MPCAERAKLFQRPDSVGFDPVELLRQVGAIGWLARHADPYLDRHQPLLRAVVKISSDAAARLARLHDPRA